MNDARIDTKTRIEFLKTLRILSISQVGSFAAFLIPTLYALSTFEKSHFTYNLIWAVMLNLYYQPVFWYGRRFFKKLALSETSHDFSSLLEIQQKWYWFAVLPGAFLWSGLMIFNFPPDETKIFLLVFLVGNISAISISYSVSKKMVWSYVLITCTTLGIMSYLLITPLLSIAIVVYVGTVLKISKETGEFIEENLKLTVEKEELLDKLKSQTESLTKSQEISRNANKVSAITQITNTLSHEINNPLQVIKMNAERGLLKLKNKTNEVEREKLESIFTQINSHTDRITSKVNSLQNISRESEKHFQATPLNLSDLVRSEVESFETANKVNDIKILRNITKDISITAHEESIRQIILALLSNAYDSIKTDHGPSIEIIVNTDDGFPVVEVSDSGKGVPADLREKIFEPFYSSKSRRESLGLGLSTARSLAENMGARLFVKNSDKSTFRIEFSQGKA